MRICILASNEHIEEVREKAKTIPELATVKILKEGVSPTGKEPATHWFCSFNCPEGLLEKIKALQEYTIIERSGSSAFLEKHGLKRINEPNPYPRFRMSSRKTKDS